MKVKEVVNPGKKVAIEIPAKYNTITKRELVQAPQTKWSRILCKTNATPSKVYAVQKALKLSGFNPGRLDGQFGKDTSNAIKRFQKQQRLAQGGLTLETLKALKVSL